MADPKQPAQAGTTTAQPPTGMPQQQPAATAPKADVAKQKNIAAVNRNNLQDASKLELVEGMVLKDMHMPKGSKAKDKDGKWVEANWAKEGIEVQIPDFAVSAGIGAKSFSPTKQS